jgi:hypothetical protein
MVFLIVAMSISVEVTRTPTAFDRSLCCGEARECMMTQAMTRKVVAC